MEIKELAERAKNNDSGAWTELFSKTKDMVYFTALKLCGNKQNAEDIVQETYIKAMENISSLRAPEAFVTWLRMIAVNTARNQLAKTSPAVFGSDESDEILQSTPEVEEDFLPAEYASKRETARIIMRIIDSLPEKQRIAVILYYYNEVSVAEIARMMNVSENTVKSRLNYARAQIKEQVEELEKKGTKLHGAVPFLTLALGEAAKDYILAEEAATAIAATLAAGATAAAATAATATTAATTAATTGILAKIAALPLATKVIAGVLGVAVALGGAAVAVGGAVAVGQMLKDGDKPSITDSTPITKDEQNEYSKFNLVSLLSMDKEEVEATFDTDYEIENGFEGAYEMCYTFAHADGGDHLRIAIDAESERVYEVAFFGSMFKHDGLCTEMSASVAKKILADKGYVLEDRYDHSNEAGEYTQEVYMSPDGTFDLFIIYSGDEMWNITLYPIVMPVVEETTIPEETEESVETTVPDETEEPIETTEAITVVTPAEKALLYTFKQNDAYTNGLNKDYIPYIKMYSDGTFEGLANIYYATVKVEGTWRTSGDGNYTMSVNTPKRTYEFATEEFNLYYNEGNGYGVVTFYPGDSMGITVDGATFDFVGEISAPNVNTNEGAHEIFEEFRLSNHTNSDGSKSYAYADVTHDGIEELIVMTNSEGATVQNPSAEAYYEVFTLKGGTPTMIYKNGTGFTTNSMYDNYLYTENGKAYLMTAAFFERQGSPWYFYEIYSLTENGEKIFYKGRDVSLDYGFTDYSPLDLVKNEYRECLKSSNVLVIPIPDDYSGFAATTGWWYKN